MTHEKHKKLNKNYIAFQYVIYTSFPNTSLQIEITRLLNFVLFDDIFGYGSKKTNFISAKNNFKRHCNKTMEKVELCEGMETMDQFL